MLNLELQRFGGRGGESGGGGGNGGNNNASSGSGQRMSSATLQNSISDARGHALTSADVNNLAKDLNAGAKNGDSITSRENNSYHPIEDKFVKQGSNWQYTRTNLRTNEVYENRSVSSREVASEILETGTSTREPQHWDYHQKR